MLPSLLPAYALPLYTAFLLLLSLLMLDQLERRLWFGPDDDDEEMISPFFLK